ncbi:hypothetical protein C8A05DRAFT_17440 [Staphylotrichum tortipilum]|uniref:Uncharacterized protein n=1 Tax=Staphylotrichum tortipilum TaxID=2831512 RepID=A0AAN6MHV6_9PEZI|nr:hypothetical protein C8A05DRAFT_17440 [Staphylotrichum longicolle]
MAKERSGPIRGARPITPGDLDTLWKGEKYREVANRTKYLVRNQLEVPSQIHKAYLRLKERGGDWRTASNEEIFHILGDIPPSWDLPTVFKRRPVPPLESEYHDFMDRIDRCEKAYLGYDGDCEGGRFLDMLNDARNNTSPDSFYQRLRQAGITVKQVIHFASHTTLPYHLLPVYANDHRASRAPGIVTHRRNVFVADLAMFLGKMQESRHKGVSHTSFDTPSADDEYISKGVMKVDRHTFLLDTSLNGGILRAVQEAGHRPAVIMTYFTFWPDGRDQDEKALANVYASDYGITHWLTEYYNIYYRAPGNGFVDCSPTIYIRKPEPGLPLMQRVVDHVVQGDKPRYRGPK